MSLQNTMSLMAAACVATGMMGASAIAQNASDTGTRREREVVEEIIVTAERVSRSLRDTATSIAVLSETDLALRPGLDSTTALLERIANISTSGKSGTLPAVRGVDGTGPAQGGAAFTAGTRSRLAYQLDGRPLSFNESAYGNAGLWDVQQVEVLRGPQSALQGRNAIAGTVAVKTKDPTFDYQGGVMVKAGNYQEREGAFYFSGPLLADQLAFRVAYDREEYDSYTRIPTTYPGVDDPEHFILTSARAKLLIAPKALEGFSTLVIVNRSEFSGPQVELVRSPYAAHVSVLGYMPRFTPESTSVVVASTYERSANLVLESTLSYTDFSVGRASFPRTGIAQIDGRESVFEPRVRFAALAGRLTGLAGLYYFHSSQDELIDLIGGLTFEDSTTNTAAFTELKYAASERFDVTLGGRYEREQRERHGVGFFTVNLDETYDAFMPKLVLAWHPTPQSTIGAVVSRSFNGGGAAFTINPPFVNYTYRPEYVWNYEAYWRATVSDGRLRLQGNVFHSDYKDYQLDFDINPDPLVYAFIIRNAEQVRTYGSELGLRWSAASGLDVFADVGVLKTDIAKYPGNSVEGNELPRSPKLTAQAGIAYAHPLGFDFSIDARYSGSYYSSAINYRDEVAGPFWVANAQAGYNLRNMRLFATVRNLFDEGEPLQITRAVAVGGASSAYLMRPRNYSVGFRVDF